MPVHSSMISTPKVPSCIRLPERVASSLTSESSALPITAVTVVIASTAVIARLVSHG